LLQHYRLAAIDPADPADPIRYLGSSLLWDCCGFYDTEPETGRVTVPEAGAHLHLHGCSLDLRYGGGGTCTMNIQAVFSARFGAYPCTRCSGCITSPAI
jgi:hypothetical protein